MASGDLLNISPPELKFRFELKKQVPTSLRLYNTSEENVAFKVKTTSPKKYCVRPNTGIVKPGQTTEVVVIMQQQKEVPTDLHQCKDKFLVQSVAVGDIDNVGDADNKKDNDVLQELFKKDNLSGKKLFETKLRVSYVQPIPPPSPVPENTEGEAAAAMEATTAPVAAAAVPAGAASGDLQTKYTNAMSNLAMATSERNAAVEERERSMRDIQIMKGKMDAMTIELSSKSASGSKDITPAAKAAAGFSLLHLLLTAILAFIVGRFT